MVYPNLIRLSTYLYKCGCLLAGWMFLFLLFISKASYSLVYINVNPLVQNILSKTVYLKTSIVNKTGRSGKITRSHKNFLIPLEGDLWGISNQQIQSYDWLSWPESSWLTLLCVHYLLYPTNLVWFTTLDNYYT